MVTKKDILDILEYVAKNYEWKNHESDFTPFTYTTLSGREVTIKVLELTQNQHSLKKSKKQKQVTKILINGEWMFLKLKI